MKRFFAPYSLPNSVMVHGEMLYPSVLEVLVPVVFEHRLLWSSSSSTCRLGASPLRALLEPIHILESGAEFRLLQGCASSQMHVFWKGKKIIIIVVEGLVDLEVNHRKREQSAAPYV